MKVLVIGRGGREHAICRKIKESAQVGQVFVAPGHANMVDVATLVPLSEDAQEALVTFARKEKINLVIIGPEAPLNAGLADRFSAADIPVFGPKKEGAIIEGSKSFAKELMQKYDIPTADYAVFTEYEAARAYVEEKGAPIVIKADGLAAGKGVVVALTKEEALESLADMMVNEQFGEASATVVIEEFLVGEEFTLMAFVNGNVVVPMEIAQDHKRAFDGDEGPNTGGMGAYSPVPQISQAAVETAIQTALIPTAAALVEEGREFCGILYAGLILTADGPKVIEFNARFGDPETQVVLPRMESDLYEVMMAIIAGEKPEVKWSNEEMIGVVIAANGYPGEYEKGAVIKGLDSMTDVFIYHAGTDKNEAGEIISNGGRVLLVGAKGDSLVEAQKKVYKELEKLDCDGVFYRTDIGNRAIAAKK